MSNLWTKILVVLRAAPTYLAVFTLLLTVFAEEIIPLLPDNAAVVIAGWVAVALAWVAAIVRVISRVTPVQPADRGLLPVEADIQP